MSNSKKLFIICVLTVLVLAALTAVSFNAAAGSRAGPTLNGGGVNPTTGDTNTNFYFDVTYKDSDGDMPIYVWLIIDDDLGNQSYSMFLNGTNASVGIDAHYSMQLALGGHSFYFHCINFKNETARLPSPTGFYYMNVTQGDRAPTLYSHTVSTTTPEVNETVNFTVQYKDLDNDAPDYVELCTYDEDSQWMYNHTMIPAGSAYSTGVQYTAAISFSMSGIWRFWFETAANGKEASHPPGGGYYNLSVSGGGSTNHVPSIWNGYVTPQHGQENDTTFTYRVTYQDLDDDAPTIKHLYINGLPHLMKLETSNNSYNEGVDFVYSTKLSAGNYTYHFMFSDGKANVTLPINGTYYGPYVNKTHVNRPPTLYVNANPFQGYVNQTFYFNASGSDPDGDLLTYHWIFSDSWNATGQSVQRLFSLPGNYTATCTVQDPYGASASGTVHVSVINQGGTQPQNNPPVIKTNLAPITHLNQTTTLYMSAAGTYDPDNDPLTYVWTVVDPARNNTATVSNIALNYTFSAPGNYSITLSVTDGTATVTASFIVYLSSSGGGTQPKNKAPVARATAYVYNMVAYLTGHGSYDPDGNIVSYTWKVDGQTYNTASVNHTFKNSGYHSAILVVKDNGGLTAAATVGFFVGTTTDPNSTDPDPEPKNHTEVGSHIEVTKTEDELILNDLSIPTDSKVTVSIAGSGEDFIKFLVDSGSPEAKLVVMDIEEDVLDFSGWDKYLVKFDNEEIDEVDLESVMSASGTDAVYCLILTQDGVQLLVYVPHFSEHSIEVRLKNDDINPDTDSNMAQVAFWIAFFAIIVIGLSVAFVIVFLRLKRKREQEEYYEDFNVAEDKDSNGVTTGTVKEDSFQEDNRREDNEDDDEYWDDFL